VIEDMKVFTTVEISKEDLDKTVDGEICFKLRIHTMLDVFLDLIDEDIPVQIKFTNLPPRPYPGFRPASGI